MKKRRVIFVCNALEDVTRIEREINSDSPAASNKIFQMGLALKSVGERVIILSMGRGQSTYAGKYFNSKVCRLNGIVVVYADFSQKKYLSKLVSFISMPYILYRLRNFKGKTTAVFYNRTTAYISSLLMSVILKYSRVLDLEDGDLSSREWSVYKIFLKVKRLLYETLCSSGTILACSALANKNSRRVELHYYGAVNYFNSEVSWVNKRQYRFLMGGTVSYDTGANNLIEVIDELRSSSEPWVDKLEFIITGKGDCIKHFEELAKIKKSPSVKLMGRLTKSSYDDIVMSCDVGLALKPNAGSLANTTFPSKVIEFASQGLLVLTTNISDVKFVLGEGALYLENDKTTSLLTNLQWIVENPDSAQEKAKVGVESIKELCTFEKAGANLSEFIF